jgi:MoaA/NifB/PqqE/SkfB family radical SAM enzyme
MTQIGCEKSPKTDPIPFPMKLWIYSNYDCNLRCSYCVAESSPKTPRRAVDLATVQKIIDEALDLGFQSIYFTGGEPFLLDEIYDMLSYASAHMPTTVLTNAMLFRGARLEKLSSILNQNLTIQVSLDGSCPEHHDPYRGSGSWKKTLEGISTIQKCNFQVRISTTETPANTHYLDQICEFRHSLGVSDEDHFIRPLAKRGFSSEGLEVGKQSLIPELTINAEGVYWHPLSTDPDLLVSSSIFPLAEALSQARSEFGEIMGAKTTEMQEFQ